MNSCRLKYQCARSCREEENRHIVEDVFFHLVRTGHAYTVYDPVGRRLVFVTRGQECQAFPLERN